MIVFVLYLLGSVILALISLYALRRAIDLGESPWTHAGFLVASLLFCAGGVAGLVAA